jgi:FAD-dependent urate hydroxylase
MASSQTDLLIIGAGPFGLSIAAYASHAQIEHLIVGRPMEFWKSNMPKGMFLRSASDWHLDAAGDATMERFFAEQNQTPSAVQPLSLDVYLQYVKWFSRRKQLAPIEHLISSLSHDWAADPPFTVVLDNGDTIRARRVVVAIGFKYFKNLPIELIQLLPEGSYGHTCDEVDFLKYEGKRLLIVGGRQSAFEWAALLAEAGAAEVHVTHRHDSPQFAQSDWTWVNPVVDAMVNDPAWYRSLSESDKESINQRMFAEGRLKLEPWLQRRMNRDSIKLWPRTQIASCTQLASGELSVLLNSGIKFCIDHIILATGYKVSIGQVPFLNSGNLLPQLRTADGFPELDDHLQTNIPGLFMTSMPAAQQFGPFFNFTVSVRTAAKLIVSAIAKQNSTAA